MWLQWCWWWRFQQIAPSSPLCVRWCDDKRGGWFSGLGRGKSWPITPVTGVGEALWCRRDKYSPWLQPLSNSAPVHTVQKYAQCIAEIQWSLCAQTLALLLGYSLHLSGAVRVGAICRKRWAAPDEDATSPLFCFNIFTHICQTRSNSRAPRILWQWWQAMRKNNQQYPHHFEVLYHLKLHSFSQWDHFDQKMQWLRG